MEWQQNWFLIVRQARILLDNDHLIHDEFESSTVLQKWIGISYNLSDDEATPSLYKSIANELNIGIANLPQQSFLSYFLQPFSTLIQHLLSTN